MPFEIEYVYARVADVCGAFTVGTRTRRGTSSWRITSRRCSRAASDRRGRGTTGWDGFSQRIGERKGLLRCTKVRRRRPSRSGSYHTFLNTYCAHIGDRLCVYGTYLQRSVIRWNGTTSKPRTSPSPQVVFVFRISGFGRRPTPGCRHLRLQHRSSPAFAHTCWHLIFGGRPASEAAPQRVPPSKSGAPVQNSGLRLRPLAPSHF